ncbi:hypothetical protein [Gracilibacillus alcaliphilus]|uniref:hypothetical protein n=1 Tax=Gracilibacillus alcaliphilus TaxID=1401441 RepID=UPI00195D9D08|nr:hypothetical protein [Gracilibacillus alcaliphilus]MBM7675163.1 hypothetical protein [Gracilibacillus alcaliphilus]
MKEHNKNDQAASLRNKVASKTKQQHLPPRSEKHSTVKGKMRWKVSPALLRIIFIFVVVLLLIGWIIW